MSQLRTFTFKVTGRPDYTVEAETPGQAMGLANAHFGSLEQGCWMDSPSWAKTPDTYTWTLGNFFD